MARPEGRLGQGAGAAFGQPEAVGAVGALAEKLAHDQGVAGVVLDEEDAETTRVARSRQGGGSVGHVRAV
jgi:hypothetical protein